MIGSSVVQERFEVVPVRDEHTTRVTSRAARRSCGYGATPFDSKELALATAPSLRAVPLSTAPGEPGEKQQQQSRHGPSRCAAAARKGGGCSGAALCSPHTGLSARRRDQVTLAL